jgi:hypothetical protein
MDFENNFIAALSSRDTSPSRNSTSSVSSSSSKSSAEILNEKMSDQISMLIKENNELKQIMAKQNSESSNQMFQIVNLLLQNGVNGTKSSISGSSKNLNSKQSSAEARDSYLNENYKDAVNLDFFLNFIKVSSSDLFNGIRSGNYTDTFISITRRALQDLGSSKKPIHIDTKKKVLYYKDNTDKWVEEYDMEKIFRKIAFAIEKKLFRYQTEYKKKNPKITEGEDYSITMIKLCEIQHKDIAKKMIKKMMNQFEID